MINVGIRTLLIDINVQNENMDLVDTVFLLQQPYVFLSKSLLYVLVGFSLLTLSYLCTNKKISSKLKYNLLFCTYSIHKIKIGILFLIFISISALIFFIQLTLPTEISLDTVSQYRGVSQNLSEYRAYGYLRMLIGLSAIAFCLSYSEIKKNSKNKIFFISTFIFAFCISLFFAFYTQSRASIIFCFVNLLIITYYQNNKRIKILKLMATIIVSVLSFFLLTCLRQGAGFEVSKSLHLKEYLNPLLLNNGGIDASKTGHVIEMTINSRHYEFGSTLIEFITLAIPRQIWHNKPANLDTFIGQKIYDANSYGSGAVPPGFIAEMFLNFGFFGIIIGCVVFGYFFKKISSVYESCAPQGPLIILKLALLQIGIGVMGSGFSSAVMGFLMVIIPLIIFHYLTKSTTYKCISSTTDR